MPRVKRKRSYRTANRRANVLWLQTYNPFYYKSKLPTLIAWEWMLDAQNDSNVLYRHLRYLMWHKHCHPSQPIGFRLSLLLVESSSLAHGRHRVPDLGFTQASRGMEHFSFLVSPSFCTLYMSNTYVFNFTNTFFK